MDTIVSMLGQLGQLLNDPSEDRYSAFDKLVRLNIAQQEYMSSASEHELSNLVIYNHYLQPNGKREHFLPLDFFRILGDRAIVGVQSGPMKLLGPEQFLNFPYQGCYLEPVVKISGKKLLIFGRAFDQGVNVSYYRYPRWMNVDGVGEGYTLSTGTIVAGAAWDAPNVGPEILPTSHQAIIQRAYQSFLVSDSEVKPVAVGGQEVQGVR